MSSFKPELTLISSPINHLASPCASFLTNNTSALNQPDSVITKLIFYSLFGNPALPALSRTALDPERWRLCFVLVGAKFYFLGMTVYPDKCLYPGDLGHRR